MQKKYSSIVVLTGAGISAESGIKTFRANDGLWEGHKIEDVATPEAFQRDSFLVHQFYNTRRRQLISGIEPNKAHKALAEFEVTHRNRRENNKKPFTLITQNVDHLHEQAGSDPVIHMHGELLKMRCVMSGEVFECHTDIQPDTVCACCHLSHTLRPHIVWFGEMPLLMSEIEDALSKCDLFVSIGTSGNVYPAASFFQMAKFAGADTVELNLEPSTNSREFDKSINGPATEIVPVFFQSLLMP
jgi:NAD-dependent deacetylase